MAEQELYFRVKVGLRDSDGARILDRRLGPRAYTYVPDLWDWFVRQHPEGQIVGQDAAYLIARGAGWEGDADSFCSAMISAGFLATIPEGFRVKGWREWAGFHFEIRAKEKAKKRGQRGGRPQGQDGDVPGTSRGQAPEKTGSEVVCPGDPSPISSLSVSEGVQGENDRPPPAARLSPLPRRDERFAERFPATAELLDTLDGLGFRAEWPRDDVSRRAVESATIAATVPIAAARVMAVVERERAAGTEPRPWLGWHLKAISPDRRDVRVGMADPGKPEDFEEGEHELRM